MAGLHRISLGNVVFQARSGERLLDSALSSGVDLPHDCRAGRCGACLTRVASGVTLGGESHQPGMVHACQAMVFSDLHIEVEALPPVDLVSARVAGIEEVGEDIMEVAIQPARPIEMLAGQYCKVQFRGFPARPFSPTGPVTTRGRSGLHFHIKRVRDGRVTPHLGSTIKAGHPVSLEGPFGHAFLRPGRTERLVLVGSGTGFAPVWAVAIAALRENAHREIVLVAASRTLAAFYMAPALVKAASFPNVSAIANVSELTLAMGSIQPGRAIEHLPRLTAKDCVYAGGAPGLVDAVAELATAAGATFYCDPFAPAQSEAAPGSWIESAKAWLKTA